MQSMKQTLVTFILILATLFTATLPAQAAERFKPFVLAWRGNADFAAKVEEVRESLEAAKFQVVADVTPYPEDAYVDDLHILVFTSPQLKRTAARSGHGGFAAAQRVAITRSGNDIQVAYVNPVYIAHAYRLKSDLADVASQLEKALGRVETFGSKKGLTKRKLRKYHYTFGMEYFDNPYQFAEYASYADAVKQVEKNLKTNGVGVRQVYRIDIPGKEETIIGVTRHGEGKKGEKYDDHWIMDNVDFGELHTTAYLPYEIMITGNKVIGLNMRFRMAVLHPDLKMMGKNSFMNIMPSPGAVRDALTSAVGGKR